MNPYTDTMTPIIRFEAPIPWAITGMKSMLMLIAVVLRRNMRFERIGNL